jgi:hypothetical protein
MRRLPILLLLGSVPTFAQMASTGLVMVMTADINADTYGSSGPPPSGNTASGGSVAAWADHNASDDFVWTHASGGPLWLSSGLNGLGSLSAPGGTVQSMVLYNKAETTLKTSADIITASAFTVWWAFDITSNCSNAGAGTPYNETSILTGGDIGSGSYWGVHCKTVTGTTYVCVYAWSSGPAAACATVVQGGKHIFMGRLDSGNLVAAIDNGTEVTTASGNVTSLASQIHLFNSDTSPQYTGLTGMLAVYNIAETQTDRTTNWNYLTTKWVTGGGGPTHTRHQVTEE